MTKLTEDRKSITHSIKKKAAECGFEFTGISAAVALDESEEKLKSWLDNGYHGGMSYMEKHFDMRLDPRSLLPGAKSVISMLYNYYPEREESSHYKIARYAGGRDYHKVVKKRLKPLIDFIKERYPTSQSRICVDSAPIMERQWAAKSGLGWLGKNTLLINRERGSYFFLAEILTDIELEYDTAIADYCGSCTRCLDACPTSAFPQPYVLDASKCISYATIELRDEKMPSLFSGHMEDWIFGCDICQEVCPWNRFSKPTQESEFEVREEVAAMKKEDWENLDEEKFGRMFSASAVKRAGFEGLKRNIEAASLPKIPGKPRG